MLGDQYASVVVCPHPGIRSVAPRSKQQFKGGPMTKRFVVILITALIAVFAMAQSMPTATLIGKVSADAAAVPGVTVTVISPNLQGTRSTETTQTGDYILPLLPPGNYTVRSEEHTSELQSQSNLVCRL